MDATRDEEKVQRALEEHLDVADLGPRMAVVREAMQALEEARAERRRRKEEEEGEKGLSQSLSQASLSLGDELSQANGGAKKRKRVAVPGGRVSVTICRYVRSVA